MLGAAQLPTGERISVNSPSTFGSNLAPEPSFRTATEPCTTAAIRFSAKDTDVAAERDRSK